MLNFLILLLLTQQTDIDAVRKKGILVINASANINQDLTEDRNKIKALQNNEKEMLFINESIKQKMEFPMIQTDLEVHKKRKKRSNSNLSAFQVNRKIDLYIKNEHEEQVVLFLKGEGIRRIARVNRFKLKQFKTIRDIILEAFENAKIEAYKILEPINYEIVKVKHLEVIGEFSEEEQIEKKILQIVNDVEEVYEESQNQINLQKEEFSQQEKEDDSFQGIKQPHIMVQFLVKPQSMSQSTSQETKEQSNDQDL